MPSSCSSSALSLQAPCSHSVKASPNATPTSIDGISGNVSSTVKQAFLRPGMIFSTLHYDGTYRLLGFAMETVFQRVAVIEITSHDYEFVEKKTQRSVEAAVDGKVEAMRGRMDSVTLVCEVDVLPDMANNHHHLHGGCVAFLIDMCSSLSVVALTMTMADRDSRVIHNPYPGTGTVSQSLNVVYHSPSPVGDRLRIVNTTMPLPSSPTEEDVDSNVCIRTEIWSIRHHRLVASGVHNKMSMSSSHSETEVSRKSLL